MAVLTIPRDAPIDGARARAALLAERRRTRLTEPLPLGSRSPAFPAGPWRRQRVDDDGQPVPGCIGGSLHEGLIPRYAQAESRAAFYRTLRAARAPVAVDAYRLLEVCGQLLKMPTPTPVALAPAYRRKAAGQKRRKTWVERGRKARTTKRAQKAAARHERADIARADHDARQAAQVADRMAALHRTGVVGNID